MKGLSSDIQASLDIIIEGLNFDMRVEEIDPDKLKSSMQAKHASFKIAKELLLKWYNSPNSPSLNKFETYVSHIIEAGEGSLKTLREALRAPIDYEELEEHKHKAAMETKLVILNSINDMESSIVELTVQLETGTVNLKENEFKRGYAEKFAYGEFFPLENYYKKYRNEKEDAIVIDPKGSRGEIIELDGLKIQLPHPPRDKTKILFHDKKKEDQYWRREPLPQGLTPSNAEPFATYILEQFRKRREGVWFYNNGKPTWLSPRHWFQLQWGKMLDDGIYPSYREAQRDLFYHKEACYIDEMCMGQIFLKSRQTGYTYGMMSDSINLVTCTKNIKTGLTSMNDDDARRAFEKMTYTFQELPFFFQPIVKGRVDSPTKLVFAKPSDASKESKKKKDTSTDGYLNSSTDYEATKAKAYDGQHMKLYIGDECFDPNTKVLMSDMSFKKIVDVKAGEKVLVEGGKKIEVDSVFIGLSQMYEIVQPYGKNYVVSQNHNLLFEKGKNKKSTKEVILKPEEYLSLSKNNKRIIRRKTFSGIEFKKKDFFISPYILGAWLGDGYSKIPKFIINPKKDPEILEEVIKFAKDNKFEITKDKEETENYVKLYLKDTHNNLNRFNKELKDLGIWGDKRIPKKYLTSSINQRLDLLSGIIDTDGYKNKKSSNVFVITMSRKDLIKDIYNLSKSVGLDTSEVIEKETNHGTKSYRVSITDYKGILNNKVSRKVSKPTKVRNRRGKIEGINRLGIGEFCGIRLKTSDANERKLILEDYTLSMNCAKWDRVSYVEHLNTLLPTTFRGGRVVGKVFLGSTMGRLDSGGEDFKILYLNSKVIDRQVSGYTSTKLYSYFMPAQTNYEDCIDKYGKCWQETPPKGVFNIFGKEIKKGSVQAIKEQYADAKLQGEVALNAAYRAFPMTENHAMRDEAESCVFNLGKLTDQQEHNDYAEEIDLYATGNFEWVNNIPYTEVEWVPSINGRFKVAWMPSDVDDTMGLRNNVRNVRGTYHPMNEYGCIGVDCYGSYSKGKNKQSKGAAHGFSKTNEYGAPQEQFIFEYIDKPATQDIFNDDIIKAAWFYGIPILAENNRRDFVRYAYLEGCRGFSMNRVDKNMNELSGDDLLLGGQPMTGKDMLDSHENAIRSYIQNRVGISNDPISIKHREPDVMGTMPFNDTIADWTKFDPSNRTAFDATISSGLSLIGCRREKYKPKRKKADPKKVVSLLRKYDNSGSIGSII